MSTTKDKEDEDSSTKQILEYYRKYSQSKDLPKYFSGSVQYLPKIVDDDDEESTKTQTESNTKATVVERGRRYENYEPDIELSPTGSAASNRKLEWDSLGDIGYIQRSSSLPILTQDRHFESNKEPKGNNVKIVILPYTSSSEEASSERNTLQSSSSSSPLTKKDTPTISSTSEEKQKSLTSDLESPGSDKKIVDFQHSLDYLKKKIGLPEAHSTPKDPQTKNNEKVNIETCENKEVDIPLNPTKKVINLCLTKPLLLDCLSHMNVKKLNIGIQTDDSLKKTVPKQSHELVTFYKHSDTLKTSSDSAKSTSSNAIASKCDSFEYVKNNSASVENENIPVENPELTNNTHCKEDSVDPIQPVTSTDVNLIENDIKTSDIERGVYVLQRLIKSKKYDSSTKKKYIKKILQKITESKYLDDSNSSTSSDLFYPKVDTVKILQDQRHNSLKINKPDCTDSDMSGTREGKAGPSKSEPTPSTSKANNSDCIPRNDKKKTLSDKGIVKESTKEPKKTLFTVTKCQEISSDQSSSSPQSYQNWRELKTVSEKFFEGGGDTHTQFANKERECQLNWIEKEMDHLGKLKSILEKTKKTCPSPKCMKKTSVYMVAASNNKEIKRNYVIETKLGNTGRSQHRNFRINGETYTVKDPNCESFKDPQPVVADIKVLSTDTTTNIKVTTFCSVCKRAPCVCVTDFLQGISNPFKINDDTVKEHLDSKSKTCTCSSISSSATSGKESSHTICIVCHRSPCTCCACKQIHNVKTCSVCQLYTCMCNISPKGSVPMEPYVGTFIPTARTGTDQISDKTKKNLCRKCKGCPCICGLSSSGSSSKKATSGTSSKSTSNSLAKVFVDCKCGPSRECSCNFVDKLMHHFSKEDFRRLDQSKPRRCIEELRTEASQSKNKYIQKKVYNFSQGETDISSGSFKTDESANANQIGVQKVPFCTDICINTNNRHFTSEKQTSVPKNFTNLEQEDQCVCTKEEKAVHPVNTFLTKDKRIGKTVKESSTQNENYPTFKTAETYSGVITSDKSIECNCEQIDKSIGTSKKDSVDRCTSPRTSLVDRGTECEPRGSLVDQATSPKCFHTDQSTASERRGVFVDDSTSCTPLLVDKCTEYTSRKTSLDKFTCYASTRVDKGTEWDPKSFVDKSVSPVCFNVDKETECGTRKTWKDQSTCTGYSQTDRATENVKKSMLNNGTSPAAFVGDKDDGTEPDGVTDVANKGTSPGRFQTDQGTANERKGVLVDDATSSTPILVDKGSEYSSNRTLDKFTSSASSRVDKGTVRDPKSLVDKSVSPVGFNVNKGTEWGARKTSKDQNTSTGYYQTDKATENVKKIMLNNGTCPAAFVGDKDDGTCPAAFVGDKDDCTEPDDVTDKAETKITTQIRTEKMKQDSTRMVSKETNISNTEKSTVLNSEASVTPNNKHDESLVTSEENFIKNRHENNNKSTQTNKLTISNGSVEKNIGNIHSNSVNVQTDLLSKDIRSSHSSSSSLEKSRKKKSKNEIICICSGEKVSRSKIICICSPCEEPKRIFFPADVGGKKSRRCCICRSSCKVDSRSMSSSPSRSKNREKICDCNVKKSRAKRANSPKIKSVMMDVSESDDSMPTNSSSNCTCYCCETNVPLEKISLLRSDDQEFPVCKECLDKRPILTAVSFADPEDESSSNRSKYTKRCENFCTCKRSSKGKDFIYCSHCKNRLRKTQQNRNGIAYTLTLEHEPLENFKTRTKKKLKKLEEIKIKVPNPYNRKQRKNNENNHKRDEVRMKKLESDENTEDGTLYFTKNETDSSDITNNKKNTNYTLQEYLKRNRPGFVNAAEFRRLALINNKIERELNKDDLKLKFLDQNEHKNILKREKLFSEHEMREITQRNYKKLPEVQKKLIEKRVQRLRSADKFMADTLKKKIQNCVLKGKSSFPIDTNIINVYK